MKFSLINVVSANVVENCAILYELKKDAVVSRYPK